MSEATKNYRYIIIARTFKDASLFDSVGDVFQKLPRPVMEFATNHRMQLVVKNELKHTRWWQVVRRYRFKRYIAELEAVS